MTNLIKNTQSFEEIIGLVPAAGKAKRIAPLPCSKELFPVGFQSGESENGKRPKVVCHYLLEKMRLAGVQKAFIVIRDGKWDIPTYFGDGSTIGMNLAYLMMRLPYGAPYTADQAAPFLRTSLVAFGFPDILFGPDDAYCQLVQRQVATHADIVMGLFPADRPETMDMVDVDEDGWIRSLVIKPADTKLRYAWIIAVWTPAFTHYQHEFLKKHLREVGDHGRLGEEELAVGRVIQAAIQDGVRGQTVIFPSHGYLDIGTPENLFKAVHQGGAISHH